jgi:hypothetical protein
MVLDLKGSALFSKNSPYIKLSLIVLLCIGLAQASQQLSDTQSQSRYNILKGSNQLGVPMNTTVKFN